MDLEKKFLLTVLTLGTFSNLSGTSCTFVYGCYQPGQIYKYEFSVEYATLVRNSILSADKQEKVDTQNATLSGLITVRNKQANGECTGVFTLRDLGIKYQDVTGSSSKEERLDVSGPTEFTWIRDDDDTIHFIKVPINDSSWNTNLRRSIANWLVVNAKKYEYLAEANIEWKWPALVTNFADLSNTAPFVASHYALWNSQQEKNLSSSFSTLKIANPYKDQIVGISDLVEAVKNDVYNEEYVTMMKVKSDEENHLQLVNKYKNRLNTFDGWGLSGCLQTLESGSESYVLKNSEYIEIRRIPLQFFETEIHIHGRLRLVSNFSGTNEDENTGITLMSTPQQMELVQLFKSDHGKSVDVVPCPKTFRADEMLKWQQRMRRLVSSVSSESSLKMYHSVKEQGNETCRKLYLDALATTLSDSAIESVLNIAEEGELDEDIFHRFLWRISYLPLIPNIGVENDNMFPKIEETSMTKLLDINHNVHRNYGMSDEVFVLHMLALRKRIKQNGRNEFTSKLLQFCQEDEITKNLGKGIKLELGRLQQTENKVKQWNGFERLRAHDPCNTSELNFFELVFNDLENAIVPEEIQVATYLDLRKCYGHLQRQIIRIFLENKNANDNVRKFIVNHVHAINAKKDPKFIVPEDQKILGSTKKTETTLGGTIFHKLVDFSGKEVIIELNYVKGQKVQTSFPNLVTSHFTYSSNGIVILTYEMEILLLDVEREDMLVSLRQNGDLLLSLTVKKFNMDADDMLRSAKEVGALLKSIHKVVSRLRQLLSGDKENVVKSAFALESRQLQWSLMGLPVEARSVIEGLFALRLETSYEPVRQSSFQGFTYLVHLEPSVTFQLREEILTKFGQHKDMGYDLTNKASIGSSLRFQINATRDAETGLLGLKLDVSFHSRKDGKENDQLVPIFGEVELLGLRRIQRENEEEQFIRISSTGEVAANQTLDIGDALQMDVLKGSMCYLKSVESGISDNLPFYYGTQFSCSLIDLHFEIVPRLKVTAGFEVSAKLYADKEREKPQTKKAKLPKPNNNNDLMMDAEAKASNVLIELLGDVNITPTNKSLSLLAMKNKEKAGIEIYVWKQQSLDSLDESKIEVSEERKTSAGIKIWKWNSPRPDILITVECNQKQKKDGKDKFANLLLEIEGIHPYLDVTIKQTLSQPQISTAEKHVIKLSETSYSCEIRESHNLHLDIKNEVLGQAMVKAAIIRCLIANSNDAGCTTGVSTALEFAFAKKYWNILDLDLSGVICSVTSPFYGILQIPSAGLNYTINGTHEGNGWNRSEEGFSTGSGFNIEIAKAQSPVVAQTEDVKDNNEMDFPLQLIRIAGSSSYDKQKEEIKSMFNISGSVDTGQPIYSFSSISSLYLNNEVSESWKKFTKLLIAKRLFATILPERNVIFNTENEIRRLLGGTKANLEIHAELLPKDDKEYPSLAVKLSDFDGHNSSLSRHNLIIFGNKDEGHVPDLTISSWLIMHKHGADLPFLLNTTLIYSTLNQQNLDRNVSLSLRLVHQNFLFDGVELDSDLRSSFMLSSNRENSSFIEHIYETEFQIQDKGTTYGWLLSDSARMKGKLTIPTRNGGIGSFLTAKGSYHHGSHSKAELNLTLEQSPENTKRVTDISWSWINNVGRHKCSTFIMGWRNFQINSTNEINGHSWDSKLFCSTVEREGLLWSSCGVETSNTFNLTCEFVMHQKTWRKLTCYSELPEDEHPMILLEID